MLFIMQELSLTRLDHISTLIMETNKARNKCLSSLIFSVYYLSIQGCFLSCSPRECAHLLIHFSLLFICGFLRLSANLKASSIMTVSILLVFKSRTLIRIARCLHNFKQFQPNFGYNKFVRNKIYCHFIDFVDLHRQTENT